IVERPELFVQVPEQTPETFRVETKTGGRWLAHGKDPNFHAWIDTAQLDYRRADTCAAVIELLQSVAMRCDGVRCDMTMLLLNEVFAKTWEQFHGAAPATQQEVWAGAIPAVKTSPPECRTLG